MQSIYETRRQNLKRLLQERFSGDRKQLQEALGYESDSLLSRLFSTKPTTQKLIGQEMARNMEKALRLPQNYLDQLQPQAATEASVSGPVDLDDLRESWDALPPQMQDYFASKIKKVAASLR